MRVRDIFDVFIGRLAEDVGDSPHRCSGGLLRNTAAPRIGEEWPNGRDAAKQFGCQLFAVFHCGRDIVEWASVARLGAALLAATAVTSFGPTAERGSS